MASEGLIVVKIGGSEGLDLERVCDDIADCAEKGDRLVVIHGGSGRANRLGEALGHPPVFLTSPSGHISRYTNQQTRDIFVQAIDELNAEIVKALRERGLRARGLTHDACAIHAERKEAIRAWVNGRLRMIRDDYSGKITHVDEASLLALLRQGVIPIIPPVAQSPEDGLLNVDGDRAAASVAVALDAEALVVLSNVPGLLSQFPDEESLVKRLRRDELDQAMTWAQGRMKRKILSVREALEGGVGHVTLADGRVRHPLRQALAGGGTWFG